MSTMRANGHKKIPKSYTTAAHLLRQMDGRKGSLNSLISGVNQKNTNIKLIYALVMKTIQNLNTIKQMMKTMAKDSDSVDSDANNFLTQVLIADLMFGKGLEGIRDVPQIRQLVSFENKFINILKNNRNRNESEKALNALNVRYIRVNRIKTKLKKVISKLVKNGFKQIDYNKSDTTFEQFKELVVNLKDDEFLIDFDFQNDLLAFNMKATKRLQELKLYSETKFVMQDKASLIAVECLQLVPGMTIMDVCCAPGMKTTAIASRVENNATIISFDMSEDRLNEMQTIIEKNGVNCCQINCRDFTTVSVNELEPIDAILLDPSCSGSGMNRRLDYNKKIEDKGRLYKLASFQTRMLSHAMSFGAKRIVYSTCSLSLIENENVVKSALRESEFAHNYSVVNAMPEWPVRGVGDYEFASKCIRSDAQTSLTNGFFVCVLEKNNVIDIKCQTDGKERKSDAKNKNKYLK